MPFLSTQFAKLHPSRNKEKAHAISENISMTHVTVKRAKCLFGSRSSGSSSSNAIFDSPFDSVGYTVSFFLFLCDAYVAFHPRFSFRRFTYPFSFFSPIFSSRSKATMTKLRNRIPGDRDTHGVFLVNQILHLCQKT